MIRHRGTRFKAGMFPFFNNLLPLRHHPRFGRGSDYGRDRAPETLRSEDLRSEEKASQIVGCGLRRSVKQAKFFPLGTKLPISLKTKDRAETDPGTKLLFRLRAPINIGLKRKRRFRRLAPPRRAPLSFRGTCQPMGCTAIPQRQCQQAGRLREA